MGTSVYWGAGNANAYAVPSLRGSDHAQGARADNEAPALLQFPKYALVLEECRFVEQPEILREVC